MSKESGLSLVVFGNRYLIVATGQVQHTKDFAPSQCVQSVVYPRDGITVFDGDSVKFAIITTHSDGTVFLPDDNNWSSPS